MGKSIRVIDGGGNGFRRADVWGIDVLNLTMTKKGDISGPSQLIDFATGDLPSGNQGIAYAMAGDVKDGVVIKSPQIAWLNGFDLAGATNGMCARKTLVFNDMSGAVAGMAELMGRPPYFLGITLSSGIGIGIYHKGEILSASEGGHVCVDRSPSAPLCGCGLHGCIEALCGGEAIARRVVAETSILGIEIPEGIHPCTFLDNHYQISRWADNIYNMIAREMGEYLATLQNILHLPLVIWKGTFALKALPLIEQQIRRYMRERLMNPNWEKEMKFVLSPAPNEDSLIGAAALFQKTFK